MSRTLALTATDTMTGARSHLREVGLVVGFAGLMALCARVTIPLPFTPVPLTLQTFAAVMTGALLGSARGVTSVGVYLLAAACGLPILSGGHSGPPIGPTGGYLLGFALSAGLVGYLAERRWDRRFLPALGTMLLGNIVIYICGLTWLTIYTGKPLSQMLVLGLYPFIPGDLLKTALAAGLLPAGWRLLGRHRS
jgi:biotin transport system substrate-specific component